MFENSGKKLKSMAESAHLYNIVLYILLGFPFIVFGIISSEYFKGDLVFVSIAAVAFGIILPIVLCVHSYRKYIYYAAFGELVEKATECSQQLEEIKLLLSGKNATEETKDVLTSTDTQEKNIPNKAVEVQNTGCSYCGSKFELMFDNLCRDCTNLLSTGTIYKCPDCNTYNYKTNICKCKHR